jgi:DNA-binding CsgD family transcriptional regulator
MEKTVLTRRETEVEKLLCSGYTRINIAAVLGISRATVDVYATNLYRKRGVHTHVALVIAYFERNGAPPEACVG